MTTKKTQPDGPVDVHIQAPAALVERLKALAEREDRTFSAEVRRALREYVERQPE